MKKGWCIWVTGLPGSGKSFIANELYDLLRDNHIRSQILSSDSLRRIMTPEPTYCLKERDVVYATLVYMARMLAENGVNAIIDATGNLRRYRESAREKIPRFMEVYLRCPLVICMKREQERKRRYGAPGKIYQTARRTSTVPGIGQPYEPPRRPELTLDTTKCLPKQCAEQIFAKILEMWY